MPGGKIPSFNPDGRPTEYREEYDEQAAKLCDLGATDEEIANFFNVHVRTIHRWKVAHPSFCHAIKIAKEAADDRVERSLYQMATGYHVTEQQAFKLKKGKDEEEVEVVDVERFQAPEVPAAIFWLKNRRREKWMDVNRNEQTGANGGPIKVEGESIAELRRRFLRASERGAEGSGSGNDQ